LDVFVTIIVILIAIALLWFIFAPSSSSPQSRPSKVTRIPARPKDPPPIEGILALVALGVMGIAAYKFVQSGGLRRLNEEIGKLPVDINGQRKTVVAAIGDDAYIEQLLRNAIQKKMREVFESGKGIETLENDTARAAADVAQILQDALEARMRREGI
jgi:hypothetical protein